jgi:hypothetical protein
VKGQIYKNAASVLVLLAASDKDGFDILERLSDNAQLLLQRPAHFVLNYEDATSAIAEETRRETSIYIEKVGHCDYCPAPVFRADYGGRSTTELCEESHHDLDQFDGKIAGWVYWQRAWTFQEWALASDLDVVLEGDASEERLTNVKTAIFTIGVVLSQYKLQQGRYAALKVGISQEEAQRRLNIIKCLFPIENLMLCYDEVDKEEYDFQASFPTDVAVNNVLALKEESKSAPSSRATHPELAAFKTTHPPSHLRAHLAHLHTISPTCIGGA